MLDKVSSSPSWPGMRARTLLVASCGSRVRSYFNCAVVPVWDYVGAWGVVVQGSSDLLNILQSLSGFYGECDRCCFGIRFPP